jgi:serine/threonine protein kinase/tetratricopeptide (TPR) repeat protein
MVDQAQIDALVVRYEELQAQNTPISAEELCRDHPEWLDELKRQLQVLEAMNALLHVNSSAALGATASPDMAATGFPEATPGEALSTGSQYRVLRLHARGGLGEVFLAQDEKLRRQVALKRLQTPHTRSPQNRRRFLWEAEVTSLLEHPNIVPVHAVGEDADGRPFYAMRFVQGETFHDAIQRWHTVDTPCRDPGERLLTFRQLVSRFVAVCNTVAYAHSRGIVHRDIKPSNILLGPYGETLLLDWGLAKSVAGSVPELPVAPEPSQPSSQDGPADTQLGAVLGTPAYMSPEQAEGRWDLLGPASDIHSLGATLYALLTGQPPFQGRHVAEILDRVQRGDFPPPRHRKKDIPRALEAVCLKAMAHKPEQRYATALDVAADLEHWLADEPVSAWREPWTVRTRRWLGRHRTFVIAAAATVLVATVSLAATTWLLTAANQRERQARNQATENLLLARRAVDEFCTKVSTNPRLADQDLEELRKELLQSAVRFHEEFVRQRSDDPDILVEQAQAYVRLGAMTQQIASPQDAVQFYQQALEIFARLAREHPSIPAYRQGLGTSYSGRGMLYLLTGRPAQAEEDLTKALSVRQELVQAYPADASYQADLAHSHDSRGHWYKHNNQLEQARAELGKSLDLRKELVQKYPTVSDYQSGLADVHLNLGVWLFESQRRKESEEELRRSLALWDELARSNPSTPQYASKQAYVYNNLALLYTAMKRPKEAEAFYKQALEMREKLVQTHPTVNDYKSKLAHSYHNLGALYHQTNRPAEAELAYQKGLAINKPLAEAHASVTVYAVDLGKSYGRLGHLLKTSNPPAALEWLDQSFRTHQAVLQREPSHAHARECLSHVHEGRATALTRLARHEEARQEWDKALELDDGKNRGRWGLQRAVGLAQLGEHAQATAEATALASQTSTPGFILYNAACVFALSSVTVRQDARLSTGDQDQLAGQYAAHAVNLLAQAHTAGYFKAVERIDHLKKDSDLDSLRPREDFKHLLGELEKAAETWAK